MFVVNRVQSFNVKPARRPLFGVEIEIDAGKMAGYLPVYATKEDAWADYPGALLTKIKEVTK